MILNKWILKFKSVVKEINNVINASNPNEPPELKKLHLSISTDFKNNPMGYEDYTKLLKTNAINKKVFYVKNLANIDELKTEAKKDGAVIDVRKLTKPTYYIDKFGKAKLLDATDYHEVLIVRTKDNELTKLRENTSKWWKLRKFCKWQRWRCCKMTTQTQLLQENNKMFNTGAILVNLKAVPVDYNYQELVDNFQDKFKPVLQKILELFIQMFMKIN